VLAYIDINFIATGPDVATAAAANPSPVVGQTTTLSALGSENGSGSGLTYSWLATTVPNGIATPTFSLNGTTAASSTSATFYGAGVYTFRVTITDSSNLSIASSVNVTVQQIPTGVIVSPSPLTIPTNTSTSFSASVMDQFGIAIGSPALNWAINGSGNAIDGAGNATLGGVPGSFTVTAADGAVQGFATVVVENFAVRATSTLDINLGSAGLVTINSSGSSITAAQNGVQITFSGITGATVSETGSSDSLNFYGPLTVPFSFVNCDTSTINVNSGALTFAAVPGGQIPLGNLNILSAAGAMISQATEDMPTTLTLDALEIGNNGQLDVTNNRVFINYGLGIDPIASIRNWIVSGSAGGLWNGFGIISTTARNHSTYSLGYADSADAGNPANLSPGQIEILYTLLGDANLDGNVNGTDFAILAGNFGREALGWDQADFNYDGVTNGSDFALLAANFGQGSQIAASVVSASQQTTTTPAASVASKASSFSVSLRHRIRPRR
jgi:hypothetical protein